MMGIFTSDPAPQAPADRLVQQWVSWLDAHPASDQRRWPDLTITELEAYQQGVEHLIESHQAAIAASQRADPTDRNKWARSQATAATTVLREVAVPLERYIDDRKLSEQAAAATPATLPPTPAEATAPPPPMPTPTQGPQQPTPTPAAGGWDDDLDDLLSSDTEEW